MTESYLQVLVESLEKKCEVLDKIIEVDDRQSALTVNPQMDMQAYDDTMEEKGKLIEELNKLDEGFTTTYEIVKDELIGDPTKYKDKVARMKELIRVTIDKGVTIEAKESRNKMALDSFFKSKRSEIRGQRVTADIATKYYKSMSKINNIDPQLMDHKN